MYTFSKFNDGRISTSDRARKQAKHTGTSVGTGVAKTQCMTSVEGKRKKIVSIRAAVSTQNTGVWQTDAAHGPIANSLIPAL